MNNTITLYSINELLEKQFYIPAYQRGYRWNKRQVEDLLNDIYTFSVKQHKMDGEFYCLQPIVVKKYQLEDNEKNIKATWEVVDGQQRLTTLRILLLYLVREHLNGQALEKEYGKALYTIEYQTREEISAFLDEIPIGNRDNIDSYHISKAYEYVNNWFDKQEKPRSARESILNTLVHDYNDKTNFNGVLQVIWYQINKDENAIDTFIRINLGKISLTNSELIKALFLQERFYGTNKDENENEIAKLRQLEIANDWDRIENTLQDDDFWWFLNESENKIPARIEFIFDLICEVEKKQDADLIKEIGTDRYATFRFFYQKLENTKNFESLNDTWKIVKDYFLTFQEWYSNPVLYHYIGFLIASGESLVNIKLYTEKDFETLAILQTKDDIETSLKKRIKKQFEHLKWKSIQNEPPFLDLSFSDKNKKTIREVLLLFNLQYMIQQSKFRIVLTKFPFKAFKDIIDENGNHTSWDVEHIDSFNTNGLKNEKTKVEWLETALIDIKIEDEDLYNQINTFIKNPKSGVSFDEIYSKIIALVGESENDEEVKNNIGNLTLLDAGTNRGYGNALFPTKRRKIIEKDTLGVFIPICTKNLFLKYFDTKGTSRTQWSSEDITTYRVVIEDTLTEFLPVKPQIVSSNE
ncbi:MULTISPECIES: DUF262 domain-containing protein [Bizionia]|uniref:DUF262 domain-containing protein n=1 Tax=Bizionia algoritergicola TaxID=291187 RepID=A0A5D0QYD9_9FLAO|nr:MULTISPECIES: DUF262 domain-containing protein [Bizionia]OBX22204.1 hypothetical protein BAA08_09680 [Bizionia sp. APA-3]TYB73224.1 DUF262 domain-containing protein [Bizionia algoritergicola]